MTTQTSVLPETDLSDHERRILAAWCADCAARSLHIFEAVQTGDARPRRAIEAATAYARGAKRSGALRAAGWEALRAAKEASSASAEAAGKAAGYAAATAYLHDVASPHQVRHILAAAAHAALSLELCAGSDMDVGDNEIIWAAAQAPEAVRQLVHKYPGRLPGRTRVAALELRLDAALRSEGGSQLFCIQESEGI